MNVQNVIIIPKNELDKKFETLFKRFDEMEKRLAEKYNANPKKDTKYLTRKETAKLLKISLPTLTSYVKQELIPVKRIGSRVLFLESEVWKAVENIHFKKQLI